MTKLRILLADDWDPTMLPPLLQLQARHGLLAGCRFASVTFD
jgi:hypothetical protein